MELIDTVEMMNSSDYKERFKAEVTQLRIRRYGLKKMLAKWDAGELDFEPSCPYELFEKQLKAMDLYMSCLADRAAIENIEL